MAGRRSLKPSGEGSTPSPRALETEDDQSNAEGSAAVAWIRQSAERLGLNPSVCGFDSHSEYCGTMHRLILASHTACKAAPEGVGVQFPPDALTARSSNGSGCLVLSQTIGVRFPYGLLTWPGGGMADAQRSERC